MRTQMCSSIGDCQTCTCIWYTGVQQPEPRVRDREVVLGIAE